MGNIVYEIRNIITGKIYVGSSINYESRKRRHVNRLKRGNHHSIHLQNSWNIYGEDGFEFRVLETVNDVDELISREQYYLDYFNSYNGDYGYNICKTAGSSIGTKHTDETKLKMSISHTGTKKGAPSELTKKKISKALLDKDLTESVKRRKETLLNIDNNIFKIIGKKSSETQKKNALNAGIKNPNSNKSKILIYDEMGGLMFETNNFDFDELCEKEQLPKRALIKSKRSNGDYRLYLVSPPKNSDYLKYRGWYCKYEDKNN